MPATGPDRVGHQRQALGLVVDPAGRAGGGGGDDGAVSGRDRVALGVPAGLLHRLEQARGGPAHSNGIGMLGRQRLTSDSTRRQVLSWSGSIAVTVKGYGSGRSIASTQNRRPDGVRTTATLIP